MVPTVASVLVPCFTASSVPWRFFVPIPLICTKPQCSARDAPVVMAQVDESVLVHPSGRSVQLAVRPRLAARPSFRTGVPTFSRSFSMKKGGGSGGVSFFWWDAAQWDSMHAPYPTKNIPKSRRYRESISSGEMLIVDSTLHCVVQTATRIPYVEIQDPLSESWKLGPVCVCGYVRVSMHLCRREHLCIWLCLSFYLSVSACLCLFACASVYVYVCVRLGVVCAYI